MILTKKINKNCVKSQRPAHIKQKKHMLGGNNLPQPQKSTQAELGTLMTFSMSVFSVALYSVCCHLSSLAGLQHGCTLHSCSWNTADSQPCQNCGTQSQRPTSKKVHKYREHKGPPVRALPRRLRQLATRHKTATRHKNSSLSIYLTITAVLCADGSTYRLVGHWGHSQLTLSQ